MRRRMRRQMGVFVRIHVDMLHTHTDAHAK